MYQIKKEEKQSLEENSETVSVNKRALEKKNEYRTTENDVQKVESCIEGECAPESNRIANLAVLIRREVRPLVGASRTDRGEDALDNAPDNRLDTDASDHGTPDKERGETRAD